MFVTDAVIDAMEDFDNETEAGIILGHYNRNDLKRIASRHAKRHKVNFMWDEQQERIVFFEEE